jgi:hypothetical protein
MMLVMALFSNSLFAQEVDEIVNNHIKAIGGAENWKKVNSMTSELEMKQGGVIIKVTVNQLQNKGVRVDYSVMGQSGYEIMTDKAGWNFSPFEGQTKPEPVTADDVKSSQDDLDIMDKFITYKELGKKIEYLGKDDVEGTECHKITLTDKEGKVSTYYIDASNFHIIKEVAKRKANGKERETTVTFSNYKQLEEGIVVAMSQGGDMGDMETKSVAINKIKDASIFEPKALSEMK